MGVTKIRLPETSGIGIKPISREGSERLIRAAISANLLRCLALKVSREFWALNSRTFKLWGG